MSLLLIEKNISFLFYSQIQIDIQQNGIMIALFLSAILSIKKANQIKNISNKYKSINFIQWKQKTHKSENTKKNTKEGISDGYIK